MQTDLRLKIQKGDIWAIALVIVLALAVAWIFVPSGDADAASVQLFLDGKKIQEMPLSEDGEYVLTGEYENIVSVQNGRAAIIASTCPGEDCVHSGWISAVGRSIVCLPNRVEVRISGKEADVDFVVGVM